MRKLIPVTPNVFGKNLVTIHLFDFRNRSVQNAGNFPRVKVLDYNTLSDTNEFNDL